MKYFIGITYALGCFGMGLSCGVAFQLGQYVFCVLFLITAIMTGLKLVHAIEDLRGEKWDE